MFLLEKSSVCLKRYFIGIVFLGDFILSSLNKLDAMTKGTKSLSSLGLGV